jgi:catechol 2,3-dioxygenase-like lactoylglutathione lyase family enzyme
MEQRISMVTLAVADLARSRRFYEAGLGWEVVSGETEGIVCFQLGGMVLALYGRAAFAEDTGLGDTGLAEDSAPPRPSVALAYNTRSREEVDTVIARAVDVGARLQKPAADAFWGGYSGYIADPDGHLWEIAWNPFSPIGEDGRFVWQT